MATKQNQEVVTVGGHRLTLTNLDKVLYSATETTKRDVLAYYATIGEVLIPHAANRPATRKRWVNGVGTPEKPGMMFFQKNLDESTPSWVKRRSIEHSNHSNEYPLVNDAATLIWLAQIASLEIHVPQWQFGRTGTRRNPDRLVLDLDPGDGAGLAECAEVARLVRSILTEMGLEPMPVTSGSKGIHLYAALDGKQDSDQVSAVAHELARSLEADHPDLIVSDMKKARRPGKVLIDWSQNNASKTTITPYSLRGREHPTVASPRTWPELASADLAQLDYREVIRRVEEGGDPLANLVAGHLDSLEPTTQRMRSFSAAADHADRLEKYRSKRDATKTPEPVPAHRVPRPDGNSFVIQEHHAGRLHWDFRLEHEGVLVSWALPKGVPIDPKGNHLAVQTEDHPLEYGSFEGTIPKGEYGAGEVSIWDAGSYDLEKWRDDEEIIVTLTGEPGGGLGQPRRFALIHTGGDGKAAENWLIHLMKPKASAAAAPSTTRSKPERQPQPPPPLPASLSPMLATAGTPKDIRDEGTWAFEMKWDGIRALAEVSNGSLRLTSRSGRDITATYPELAELAASLSEDSAVLDGEIVAIDARGRPDFGLLQTRMNLAKQAEIARAASSAPVHFMAFDVVAINGRSVADERYEERRIALQQLVIENPTAALQLPPVFTGDLQQAITTSRELGLEGVVAKNRDGQYLFGRRSPSWVKIKHHRTQEVVVAGWRPGNGRRADGVGSLLLGIPAGDNLRYVGRVGTGFTDRQLDEVLSRLRPLERKSSPLVDVPAPDARDAHWVTPSLVGEVEFVEWTAGEHLRQPSWRGWRPDKSASEVRTE